VQQQQLRGLGGVLIWLMGPIPLAAYAVNQQAPAAFRPNEGVRLVPKLVGLARLAP
jgi:hypothetical protein